MAKSSESAFRPALTALEDRAVPAANLQFVNNSAYQPDAAVDVYVNNTLTPALTGLQFRKATPSFVQDTGNPVFVSIRPAGAAVSTPPIFNRTFTLADNSTNVFVIERGLTASGVAGDIDILPITNARQQAATVGNAEFLLANNSNTVTPIDVKLRGTGTLANDLAFGATDSKYQSLAPRAYTFDVTLADGLTRIGSYAADFTAAGNQAFTLLGSGQRPTNVAGFTSLFPFGLLAVRRDGTATLLPSVPAPSPGTGFAVGAGGSEPQLYTSAGQATTLGVPGPGTTAERVAYADIDGHGVQALITGTGPGTPSQVKVTRDIGSPHNMAAVTTLNPFEATFTGGVFVAAGDLDGDGMDDVIVTPDQGGGPRLAIYDGRAVTTPVASGKLPPKLTADFFVFEQTLRNGVYVTLGDVSGDGYADVIVGGGPGGGPRVLAVSGRDLVATPAKQTPVGNFFAGDTANRDGVRVAAKDLDGDPFADLVVGLGSPGSPQVRGYAGKQFAASVTPGTAPTPIAALDLNPVTNPGLVYVG